MLKKKNFFFFQKKKNLGGENFFLTKYSQFFFRGKSTGFLVFKNEKIFYCWKIPRKKTLRDFSKKRFGDKNSKGPILFFLGTDISLGDEWFFIEADGVGPNLSQNNSPG